MRCRIILIVTCTIYLFYRKKILIFLISASIQVMQHVYGSLTVNCTTHHEVRMFYLLQAYLRFSEFFWAEVFQLSGTLFIRLYDSAEEHFMRNVRLFALAQMLSAYSQYSNAWN